MKLVTISDTHCQLDKVEIPDGDILIHAGDLTYRGTIDEISKELQILKEKTKNFKHRILICGNHDWLGEYNPNLMRQLCEDSQITYLCDESIEVEGKKIYGSPYQPEFCNWAFNLDRRDDSLPLKWAQIPDMTDILVTHGPPYGILDTVKPSSQIHLGCVHLYNRIVKMSNLKYHIFGHIHGGYGTYKSTICNTTFINASICNEQYKPINKPIVFEIKD